MFVPSLRSFEDFFGKNGWKAPADVQVAISRLKFNFDYYLANYLVVVFAFNLLMSIIAQRSGYAAYLVVICGVGAGSLTQTINIKGRVLSDIEKVGISALLLIFGFYVTNNSRFFFISSLLALVICAGHAIMRDRPLHKKVSKLIDGVSNDLKELDKKSN
eukprot:TRINITY_DN6239_c0_g1_i1.p1 TRINITY_DN6239_c0_g1~~TRINITY_DN6239_c0_g1_i1.p1  ORF type:complete len:160 (+),score=32.68 TRINITY_DN6239_c0_g1_i1:256-735(+)